jgi:hypothetical protein
LFFIKILYESRNGIPAISQFFLLLSFYVMGIDTLICSLCNRTFPDCIPHGRYDFPAGHLTACEQCNAKFCLPVLTQLPNYDPEDWSFEELPNSILEQWLEMQQRILEQVKCQIQKLKNTQKQQEKQKKQSKKRKAKEDKEEDEHLPHKKKKQKKSHA